MKKAVECRAYSFRYHNRQNFVLKDCDFTLSRGELVVLSGLSGEGKSTLLNSVNGIVPNFYSGEQRGELLVDGESVFGKRIAELSRTVGSVLQNADMQIIHARVEDEIAFACENLCMPRETIAERVEKSCALMALSPAWPTAALSGGQKQRLITAATLAMGQKILLFDEPLANLDLEGVRALMKTLRGLADEGYAILVAEHRLDAVLPYADRLLWLENGTLSPRADRPDAALSDLHPFSGAGKAAEEAGSILSLENLSFSYGRQAVLQGIDFKARAGERVVILGENGCGKTTLLKLIARLLKPGGGRIAYHLAQDERRASPAWFRRVGYVYQNPDYQLFMPTVRQEVGYQARSEEAARACVELFRLGALLDEHPQALSEGQKRRLGIAAITAAQPELLLLDEPTVGQDREGLACILNALDTVGARTNMTMIAATHDRRLAGVMADKIVWLRDRRVYKTGGPELADEYFSRNGDF